MKKRIRGTLFIGLLICSTSSIAQTASKILANKLVQIESFLYQDPVKAKSALLGLLTENQQLPDSEKARIYLKLGVSLGMTNRLDSAVWFTKEALKGFSDQNIEKAASLKLLATLYRLKSDFPNAEIAIKKSLELNERYWKDSYLKAITLQEYASLCLDKYDYYKATSLFLEALDITTTPDFNDPRGSYTNVKLRVNLAEAYVASKNYPFAIREFQAAMPKLDSMKDDEGLLRAGIQLADAYISSAMYQSADSLMKKLAVIAEKLQNEELQSYILLKQGLSWASRREFPEAIPYYRRAFGLMVKNNSPFILECAKNYLAALNRFSDREEAHRIMSTPSVKTALENCLPADRLEYKRIAILFSNSDLSAAEINAYYQDLFLLADSVNAEVQKRSASELQAKYQFERQQEAEQMLAKENELLKQKSTYEHYQLLFIVAVASFLLIILALSFLRLRQRARLQASELELQKERAAWMEREKSFRGQLIQQQKMMLTKSIADAEQLQSRLEELAKEQQEDRRKVLLEQLEHSKEEKLSMEMMMAQFNAVYPSFASKLHNTYPKLTQADVQFCTLFRMNLTTKEISVLLHIEPRSIYAKKYRIMEKMGLGEGDDFDKVIFGIA